MRLLSEREEIRTVAKWWQRQYGNQNELGIRLAGLDGETATIQDVSDIIGTSSWAQQPCCDECKNKSWDCVELGEEMAYGNNTAWICLSCLRKAVALAEGAGQ